MKSFLPALSSLLILGSCTAAYKSGQTPDDVYYSPARPQVEYVRTEPDDRREEPVAYYSYEDDRYLRYKVRNRSRWSYLDDYYRDPHAYQYRRYDHYDSYYWNSRMYWNSYYNPYGNNVVIRNPKTPIYNRPRTYNLHVFDSPVNNTYNPKLPSSRSREYSNLKDRNDNPSRNTGGNLRRTFGVEDTPSKDRALSTTTDNTSSRSSSPSSSSSSSGNSNKSSSNKPSRKFQ